MRHIVAVCLLALAFPGAAGAQTPVPVDGVYAGTASLQGATGQKCQQLYTFKLHVRDRVFNWTLPNKVNVPVTVGPDGAFSVENGQRFLTGRIEGNRLTGRSTGPGCGYAWSFTR